MWRWRCTLCILHNLYVCMHVSVCMCIRMCVHMLILHVSVCVALPCVYLHDLRTPRGNEDPCVVPHIWCRSHREEASLQCRTPPAGADTSAGIVAMVDKWLSQQPITSEPEHSFSYRPNPQVESVTPAHSFQR